jgi:hypothetical protein
MLKKKRAYATHPIKINTFTKNKYLEKRIPIIGGIIPRIMGAPK